MTGPRDRRHSLLWLIALGIAIPCAIGCTTGATRDTVAPSDEQPAETPPAASDPGAAQQDLCAYATRGDGPYCANSLLLGSPENQLHTCAGGATTLTTPCPGRCSQGADGMPGGDDTCDAAAIEQQPVTIEPEQPAQPAPASTAPPPSGDPCSKATVGDGGYCAMSLDPAVDSPELYHCVGGQATSVISCPSGCQVMPPGVSDVCAGTTSPAPATGDPCSSASLGDGGYCAKSLDPASTSSKLYTCVGRKTASVISCPNGCQVMPDGLNDVCASGSTSPPIAPTTPTAECSAKSDFDCGGEAKYCTSDGACKSCASGTFNCNGTFSCECKYGCFGGGCLQCSASAAFSCSGSSQWCYEGACRLCSQGYFNCDGKAGCECKNGCNGTQCK